MIPVRATAHTVDKPPVRQASDHRCGTVCRHSEGKGYVLNRGQASIIFGCQTKQIDPRAKVLAREALHLWVIDHFGVKTKPARHYGTNRRLALLVVWR